jgi:16S rRNA (uracil1498-N3)-methyltransferase
MSASSAHQFALFIPDLHDRIGIKFSITDRDIVTRIDSVLRLGVGDQCILFDRMVHAHVSLSATNKKEVTFTLLEQKAHVPLDPPMIMFLPLLKRDDLFDAVSMLTACGVSAIQLVFTEKTQRVWTDKDLPRLERLIIAAAEQSKHFAFPTLYAPRLLTDLIAQKSSDQQHLFFDPTGLPLLTVAQTLLKKNVSQLVLIVGPEGDLTSDEKQLLRDNAVLFCALTPTILRASLAAALGLGAFRSIMSHGANTR